MDFLRTWAARGAAALPFAVAAASVHAAEPARSDPANPQAAVPAVTYRSPLADYRRNGDQPVGNWRDLNDRVRAIGGWRAYAREANAPEGGDKPPPATPPSDAAPARSTPPASPGGHGGHSGAAKERR